LSEELPTQPECMAWRLLAGSALVRRGCSRSSCSPRPTSVPSIPPVSELQTASCSVVNLATRPPSPYLSQGHAAVGTAVSAALWALILHFPVRVLGAESKIDLPSHVRTCSIDRRDSATTRRAPHAFYMHGVAAPRWVCSLLLWLVSSGQVRRSARLFHSISPVTQLRPANRLTVNSAAIQRPTHIMGSPAAVRSAVSEALGR
jgi:hypothetical protein